MKTLYTLILFNVLLSAASASGQATDTISPNLDASFGIDGMQQGVLDGFDVGTVVKKDPITDGYFVAGPTLDSLGTKGVFLTRYTTDGQVDATFNGGNPVLLPELSWSGYFGTANDWFHTPMGMQVQVDGKPVLCGTTHPGGGMDTTICVMRFMPDGQPDTTFDYLGTGQFPSSIGTGLIIDDQGRLVSFGAEWIPGFPDRFTIVIRTLPDGSLDSSFGFNGLGVEIIYGNGSFVAGRNYPNAAAILPNGDILVVGTTETQLGDIDFFVSQLDSNGIRQPDFGFLGVNIYDMFGHFDWATDLLVDETTGRAYISVLSDADGASHADMAIACLNASDGIWDTGFGVQGKVQLDVSGNVGFNNDFLGAITMDDQGNLYGAGTVTIDGLGFNAFLFRWNDQGQLQTNWLDSGTDTLCYFGDPQGLLLDGDGLFVTGVHLDLSTFQGGDPWQSMDHFIAKYGPGVISGLAPESASARFSLAPNPTQGLLNLVLSHSHDLRRVAVRDLMGRCVIDIPLNGPSTSLQIDLRPFGSGLYFVELDFSDGSRSVARAVKE